MRLKLKGQPEIEIGMGPDLSKSLSIQLKSEAYECMVCFESIRRKQPIFSCSTCFAVFHLKCIVQWANLAADWRCPGCQTINVDKPREYYCFCLKQIQPEYNRLITPHSCGNTCGKKRICGHGCKDVCHPGPCSNCAEFADPEGCGCGKKIFKVSCAEKNNREYRLTCGQICGRKLLCGNHYCEQICHQGPCEACTIYSSASCFCNSLKVSVECGSMIEPFSCEEPCQFQYLCGHSCPLTCHDSGHDILCPFDVDAVKSCYCGKHSIAELNNGQKRQSCFDPIPNCDDLCGSELQCGHSCVSICHEGMCPPCPLLVESLCRCGKTQMVPTECHKVVYDNNDKPLCEKICKQKLSCKRHICDQKCCTLDHHPCDRTCGKTLSCTKHKCMLPCKHPGPCHDCVEGATFDELYCHCRKTFMYPPIPCNTRPPKCNFPCKRARECGHLNYSVHYCHPDDVPCPPCAVFVERACACGSKVLKNIPCHRKTVPSCGSKCGRVIEQCGHLCGRVCHESLCIDASHPNCQQRCGKSRSCGHVCQYPCHGTKECPETLVCKHPVYVTCECGNIKIPEICGSSINTAPTKHMHKDCNDTCLRLKRTTEMAEAMGIDVTKSAFEFVGWKEEFVKNAKLIQNTVISTEKKLLELINSPEVQFYYFPQQNLSRTNHLICEMAKQYGFNAEILDEKIGKPSVCVRRTKDSIPLIPKKLLSEICKSYNPKAEEHNPFIIKNEPLDVKSSPINGIYLKGIPGDVNSIMIVDTIKELMKGLCNAAALYWMDNAECFIHYKLKPDSTEEPQISFLPPLNGDEVVQETQLPTEMNDPLNAGVHDENDILQRLSDALGTMSTLILPVTVSPVGGIHFQDGSISHFKKRNINSFRIQGYENGWKRAIVVWKEEGISII